MHKVYLGLVLCLVGHSLAAHLPGSIDVEWENYKRQFNKVYPKEQESIRKSAFTEAYRRIEQHNEADFSWKTGLNQFSDLTAEERANLIPMRNINMWQDEAPTSNRWTGESVNNRQGDNPQLPKEFDYRNNECMPSVKSQGVCKGGGWAFSVVGMLEYQLCKRAGIKASLSEQQLLDCTDAINEGCTWGYNRNALKYMMGYGAFRNVDYPYTSGESGQTGVCNYCSLKKEKETVIRPIDWDWTYNLTATHQLLISSGPLTAHMYAIYEGNNSLLDFKSGVYDPEFCDRRYNHTVIIVGYGTDSETGKDYWIVRNSWGPKWGLDGYFLIRRGVNRCNIEKHVAYFLF